MGLDEDIVISELYRSADGSLWRHSLYLSYTELQMGLNEDVVIFELYRSTDLNYIDLQRAELCLSVRGSHFVNISLWWKWWFVLVAIVLVTWRTLVLCLVYTFDPCQSSPEIFVVTMSWCVLENQPFWKPAFWFWFSIITFSFVKLQPLNFEYYKLIKIASFCSIDLYVLSVVYVQSNVIWSKTVGKIRETFIRLS